MNRDPGLQPERTRLARRRTGLAIAVVAVLTARLAASYGSGPGLALGIVLAAGLLAVGATVIRRTTSTGARPGGDGNMPLLALVAAAYAGLGVLILLGALG